MSPVGVITTFLSVLCLMVISCPGEVFGCHYTMIIIQNGTKINTTGWAKNAYFGEP